ncbi:lectin-like protein [Dolichospermum circinale]|uniref:lectin-like protein n=5 Tax=Dolichospermum circinale TaxID=109265 RepID=UPI00233006D2|nr:lectin-like protein [Dolichospermum circinale]MDB9476323.1 lectin-like protein [Dolichospermum circinale CS-537/11]
MFNYNGSTYLLTSFFSTWEQAQAQAQSLGGNLVTINTAAEQNWLVSTFGGSQELWIGLTDKVTEGQFKWASGEISTYTNWFTGQPDNGGPQGEDYVAMNFGSAGKWNDYPNNLKLLQGIIEIKQATPPTYAYYNGSIYFFTSFSGTWEQAQDEAQSLGGNLVTINTAAEQSFLTNTFGGTEELWIGYTDKVTEGQFQWASNETSAYTNWFTGQPDNGGPEGEDYVVMNFGSAGKWNDYPNDLNSFRGIIEIKPPTYNGSTYFLTDFFGTWEDAQAQALSLGGNLVTINTAAEQNWLVSTFGGTEELWIGYTDKITEGQFKWASNETSAYANWFTGQPDNGGPQGEDYVVMNFGSPGKWNDYPNNLKPLRGIIEIKLPVTPTPINGTNGNDNLIGTNGNDILNGFAGNDTLNGGAGNDTLNGGTGNDIYVVDSTTDTITENANEGTDTIQSSVNYSIALLTNVENLTLTGTAANGTGNAGDNIITGNSAINNLSGGLGNDTLNGGAGKDTLIGGAGNDTYIVDSTDIITESTGGGIDTIQSSVNYSIALLTNVENLTLTGTAAINGTGNAGNNVITGNGANNILNGGSGNDTLNGGAGKDTLIGGVGNDTYIVDITDIITESTGGGTDTIQSSVTYNIAALTNVENLTLTGTTAINGTGNTGNNVITGNSANNNLSGGSGNDTLNGGAGNDTLNGGAGNDILIGGADDDIYVVDSNTGTITITEDVEGGTDTIESSVTYTIEDIDNVEYLTLTGTADIDGTGNTGNNVITGNSANNNLNGGDGDDTLNGGDGNDILTGGLGSNNLFGGDGNDQFVFSGLNPFDTTVNGVDIIADFSTGTDQLVLSKTVFDFLTSDVGIGLSDPSDFESVDNDELAGDSTARIVYSLGSGNLFYNQDADTAGFGTGGQFAVVDFLTADDFVIIA